MGVGMKKIILAVALLVVATCANATNLNIDPVVFQSGDWSVIRSKNDMTDATVCTGVYRGSPDVQLTEEKIYIAVRGGVEAITLRFGDSQPEPLRLATKIEKKIRSAIIEGVDFYRATNSNRLRASISTLIRGTAISDINMTGALDAIENIKSGCPGQPIEKKKGAATEI